MAGLDGGALAFGPREWPVPLPRPVQKSATGEGTRPGRCPCTDRLT
jgi:hypothetical protein